MREQIEVLENHAHAHPHLIDFLIMEMRDLFAVKEDLTACRSLHEVQTAQKGTLA